MKFAVPLAAVLLLSCRTAYAEPLSLQIGRVGEVTAEEVGPPQPPRPGNVAGIDSVQNPRFTHLGTSIQGMFCKQFGLEFKAANLARSAARGRTDGRTYRWTGRTRWCSPAAASRGRTGFRPRRGTRRWCR